MLGDIYAGAIAEMIPEGGPPEAARSGHRRRWLIIAIAALLVAVGWYLYLLFYPGMKGCACVEPTPSVTTTSTA